MMSVVSVPKTTSCDASVGVHFSDILEHNVCIRSGLELVCVSVRVHANLESRELM